MEGDKKEAAAAALSGGNPFNSPLVVGTIAFIVSVIVGIFGLLLFSIASGLLWGICIRKYQNVRYNFLREYGNKTGMTPEQVRADPRFAFMVYGTYADVTGDVMFIIFLVLIAVFTFVFQAFMPTSILNAVLAYAYCWLYMPQMKKAAEMLAAVSGHAAK